MVPGPVAAEAGPTATETKVRTTITEALATLLRPLIGRTNHPPPRRLTYTRVPLVRFYARKF
jgi:hypothetical protein